jgi:hypothetical protein
MRLERELPKLTPINRTGSSIHRESEFRDAEPDYLRDAVRNALLYLSERERSDVRSRLLAELESAGLRVRQCLLMLGASAMTAEELTAPEIAVLIRYVRLTEPRAFIAITTLLGELLLGPATLRTTNRAA